MSSSASSSPSRQARISTFFSPTHTNKRPATPSAGSDSEPPLKKQKSERWRFSLSSPEKGGITDTDLEATSSNPRREAFKRKLLSESRQVQKPRDHPSVDPVSDSDTERDRAFEELSELFSSKSGKGKGKNKGVRKPKPVEEIGPSGEPFTPLEKQVILPLLMRRTSRLILFISGHTPEEG